MWGRFTPSRSLSSGRGFRLALKVIYCHAAAFALALRLSGN
jgi:hypothetical protein